MLSAIQLIHHSRQAHRGRQAWEARVLKGVSSALQFHNTLPDTVFQKAPWFLWSMAGSAFEWERNDARLIACLEANPLKKALLPEAHI
jgi:hypothetical protein